MIAFKRTIASALVLISGWASAQVVTDSKLHLLDETNPEKRINWIKECDNRAMAKDGLKKDLAYTGCIDEILLKHEAEITRAECDVIARKIQNEKSTRFAYLRKCKEHYAYDACVDRANEFKDQAKKAEERKKCLITYMRDTDTETCKRDAKLYYPEMDQKECEKHATVLPPSVTPAGAQKGRAKK